MTLNDEKQRSVNQFTLFALFILLCNTSQACDFTAGPGKVFRVSEGEVGGFFTAACVVREKYEVRAFYFAEQRIYGETVHIKPFFAVSFSRLWEFREGHIVRPMLGLGLLFKQQQQCHFDGDLDCNRLLPLWYAFGATVGVRFGDSIQLTAGHFSNNSMDRGAEKKNLGLDGVRLEARF